LQAEIPYLARNEFVSAEAGFDGKKENPRREQDPPAVLFWQKHAFL
jgi:hypothetical protein